CARGFTFYAMDYW
nr:immunoglobulin heavy chain junction region [Mus musculus]MBK4187825.1 immunoglobulin heavy chain junction region [Mus musculus]MBK4195913.1 immunoglobulin heavy chain junction region [Mus musculus]